MSFARHRRTSLKIRWPELWAAVWYIQCDCVNQWKLLGLVEEIRLHARSWPGAYGRTPITLRIKGRRSERVGVSLKIILSLSFYTDVHNPDCPNQSVQGPIDSPIQDRVHAKTVLCRNSSGCAPVFWIWRIFIFGWQWITGDKDESLQVGHWFSKNSNFSFILFGSWLLQM